MAMDRISYFSRLSKGSIRADGRAASFPVAVSHASRTFSTTAMICRAMFITAFHSDLYVLTSYLFVSARGPIMVEEPTHILYLQELGKGRGDGANVRYVLRHGCCDAEEHDGGLDCASRIALETIVKFYVSHQFGC